MFSATVILIDSNDTYQSTAGHRFLEIWSFESSSCPQEMMVWLRQISTCTWNSSGNGNLCSLFHSLSQEYSEYYHYDYFKFQITLITPLLKCQHRITEKFLMLIPDMSCHDLPSKTILFEKCMHNFDDIDSVTGPFSSPLQEIVTTVSLLRERWWWRLLSLPQSNTVCALWTVESAASWGESSEIRPRTPNSEGAVRRAFLHHSSSSCLQHLQHPQIYQ